MLAVRQSGVSVAALDNRPFPLIGLDIYLQAYCELIYGTQGGMGNTFISWNAIANWCQARGICSIDDIDYFVRHIRALEKADFEIADKKKATK